MFSPVRDAARAPKRIPITMVVFEDKRGFLWTQITAPPKAAPDSAGPSKNALVHGVGGRACNHNVLALMA